MQQHPAASRTVRRSTGRPPTPPTVFPPPPYPLVMHPYGGTPPLLGHETQDCFIQHHHASSNVRPGADLS
jgi:hypothetical protein